MSALRFSRPPMTRSVAASKSVRLMRLFFLRAAMMAASLHTLAISAPAKPGVRAAMRSAYLSTGPASERPLRCTRKMSARPLMSGMPTVIWRSKRPGRISAGSRTWGRFVAANTTTRRLAPPTPSISARSCVSTREATPPAPSPSREAPMASISSKKMTQGAAVLAFRKTSRTARSLSPTYLEKSSGPLIEMKFISVSVATALAIIVFEQPGGP
mmetsp:Transcript_116776/g.324649  ORF Transcript_116776/g.324649 Transcript_116776/m.324649 type:complete len:214 (-) Transcript_116776:210-851(-)